MARPQKQNADYFSHDNTMRNDKKIKAVRAKFGLEGYAIYCMILESLTEANLIQIEWNDLEAELLAGDFGIDSEKLTEMINYCLQIGLLQRKNGHIVCRQLEKRLKQVFDKRKQDLDSLRGINEVTAPETRQSDAHNPQSKVNKSKVNKSFLKKAEKPETAVSQKLKDYRVILKGPDSKIEHLASKYAWSGEDWNSFKSRINTELRRMERT